MNSSDPKKNRFIGALVFALILTGVFVAVLRIGSGSSFREYEIAKGHADLKEAVLLDDAKKFAAAESHFLNAAKASVLDHEAAFLLKTVQRLQRPENIPDGHREVILAIRSKAFDKALIAAADTGEAGTKPRIYYERLIGLWR